MDSKEKEFDSLVVSRHEVKYFINPIKCMQLSSVLKNVMIEDKHNGADGYIIRSLYFDTYGEADFYEKLAGIENRKKIRLRVYSPNDKLVKLEIKRKFGDEQVKKSAFISKDDAKRLIDCDYDVLRKYENATVRTIYEIMHINRVRPVVLIEYQRKAFIHPTNNIRVTVDTNIRSNETYFGLFDEFPVFCPVEEFIFALLEIKYDAFLIHWLSELLSTYDLTNGAYSKYFISRGIFERYLT